jgi:hypothetical protein
MDVRRDCVSFARSIIAGAACVSFTQLTSISMGAKAAQYLTSGHVINPSLGTLPRRPVS